MFLTQVRSQTSPLLIRRPSLRELAFSIAAVAVLLPAAGLAAQLPESVDCYIKDSAQAVECTRFRLPLDWNKPDGADISVRVVRVRARSPKPRVDAVFVLAGGPGQAASEIIRDMEAVRRHFGYDTLDLWGGSFGTRLVQHYYRAYPDRVRSVIVDAVIYANGQQPSPDTARPGLILPVFLVLLGVTYIGGRIYRRRKESELKQLGQLQDELGAGQ